MTNPAFSDLQKHSGYWWPGGIKPTSIPHALKHVRGADDAIALARKSIAIQAGGNIGLWPLRMADHFAEVHTFEPEPVCFECLTRNTDHVANIFAYRAALGAAAGTCSIARRSLGSHNVAQGSGVHVAAIDQQFSFADDVGLIQLDIEGYEFEALKGAEQTIQRCRPVIQLELRGFAEKYGASDEEIIVWLNARGYIGIKELGGNDVIFQHFPRIA